jgi:hypothetical protein
MPDRPPPRVAVNGVMAARRALLAVADRLLPAQFPLFDKTIGLGRTHVLGTLAELGVADVLAQRPQTAAELAPQLGVDADAMPPGSRLVLVEDLQERNKPSPTASLTDLQMLTQCDDGRQRSADELKRLLEGAGLRPGTVTLTSGPALVEGLA